jgi:D-alanine--poly(phosphoribitol) ligase subunit 2
MRNAFPAERSDFAGELSALFRERLHVEVPDPGSDLFESGLLDSLQLVQLLLHIEDRFRVRVRLDEIELDDLRSIETIARLLERRLNPQPA